MFSKHCDNPKCPTPEKDLYVYAKNKMGDLPVTYCSDRCKGEVAYKKKFIKL